MIEPALLMEIIMNKVGEDEPKKADRWIQLLYQWEKFKKCKTIKINKKIYKSICKSEYLLY